MCPCAKWLEFLKRKILSKLWLGLGDADLSLIGQVGPVSSSQLEANCTIPTVRSCKETFLLWFRCSTKTDRQICVFCPSVNVGQQRLISWCSCSAGSPGNWFLFLYIRLHSVSASWDPIAGLTTYTSELFFLSSSRRAGQALTVNPRGEKKDTSKMFCLL